MLWRISASVQGSLVQLVGLLDLASPQKVALARAGNPPFDRGLRNSAGSAQMGAVLKYNHVASLMDVDVREEFGSIDPSSWPLVWLMSHSCLAIGMGAICMFAHQAFSLPCRCKSRWWGRQSGTVNSSLTFRPRARC